MFTVMRILLGLVVGCIGFVQIAEQRSGDRVVALGGAEDRERAGVEQGVQIVLGHGFAGGLGSGRGQPILGHPLLQRHPAGL